LLLQLGLLTLELLVLRLKLLNLPLVNLCICLALEVDLCNLLLCLFKILFQLKVILRQLVINALK